MGEFLNSKIPMPYTVNGNPVHIDGKYGREELKITKNDHREILWVTGLDLGKWQGKLCDIVNYIALKAMRVKFYKTDLRKDMQTIMSKDRTEVQCSLNQRVGRNGNIIVNSRFKMVEYPIPSIELGVKGAVTNLQMFVPDNMLKKCMWEYIYGDNDDMMIYYLNNYVLPEILEGRLH